MHERGEIFWFFLRVSLVLMEREHMIFLEVDTIIW